MKVCIIAPNFLEPRSWMVSAYKTAFLLEKLGINVVVLTSKTKGSKSFEIIKGVKIYRMPCFFIPDPFNYTVTPGLYYHLHKIIKKENPDIFLVNKYIFYTSLAAFYLRFKKKKFVVQTDTFPGLVWFTKSRILNLLTWINTHTLGLLILRLADKVIILHEGLINASKKLKLNYQVIHNSVNIDDYQKRSPAEDIKKFKSDNLLITWIGRLDDVKGYDLMLNAAETIQINYPNVRFLFVLGNKYPDKRRSLMEKYPSFLFEAFRSDIPNILAATDINVLTSYAEGLPNTLMEAMASKVPVIASDVGGVGALIIDRVTGLLFKSGDTKELVQKMETLIKDSSQRKQLGDSGFHKIKKEFSYESEGGKLLALFKQIKND